MSFKNQRIVIAVRWYNTIPQLGNIDRHSPVMSTKLSAHSLSFLLSFNDLETYHMIDRCDQSIATWAVTGDNFVVKNVDKFASVR